MKIAAYSLFSYRLPILTPLEWREGWLLRVTADDGRESWGEIAPLPGFSTESHDTALREIPAALSSLEGSQDFSPFCSSIRFGMESALAGLADEPVAACCRVNALLTGSLDACIRDARHAVQSGFTALKLKVGRDSVERDLERIHQIAALLPPSVSLRLDANQAWSLETALEIARALETIPFIYIEEPLADTLLLPALHDKTGWPLALDESLRAQGPRHFPGVVAWILKPMLAGGWVATRELMIRAAHAGVQAVISASFESGVGLRALAELAARQPDVPAGLDTYRFIPSDILETRLDFPGGILDLAEARKCRVNTQRLKPVL